MPRAKAHAEDQEPILENFLSFLRFRKIIRHIPSNSKVLDMGCGYRGKFLTTIKNNISSGTGLDISVDPILSNDKIKLLSCDLNKPLPSDANEFDVVTSLANLEHLDNPLEMLREIYRVLRPGGKLLLTTPSIHGKLILEFLAFMRLISPREIEDHKNYFDKKILLDLSKDAGFYFTKHRYFQFGMNNFLLAKKSDDRTLIT